MTAYYQRMSLRQGWATYLLSWAA